tara:strand:+ start:310 stop:570 length:261 start_codon:yes stop_codon:yes gene_type:complete
MYRNKDESVTVQLKDFDILLSVLGNLDYWDSYHIKTSFNKHDGLAELLKHKKVREYIFNTYLFNQDVKLADIEIKFNNTNKERSNK